MNEIRIADLNQEGFIESGKNQGEPKSFRHHLTQIKHGHIIDNSVPLPNSNKEKYLNLIYNEKTNKEKLENKISELQNKINQLKNKLKELNDLLEEWINNPINNKKFEHMIPEGSFSWVRFIFSTFFTLMLSIWLFLFYTVTIYRALYMTAVTIAEQMSEDNYDFPILPTFQELFSALSTNWPIAFAPFVFYGFGYAIHIFMENKIQIVKWTSISLIIIITFILDLLIALKIHGMENSARELIGEDAIQWSNNPTVFIILGMGFITFIIWSILFHQWQFEAEKKDPGRLLRKRIDKLEIEIGTLSDLNKLLESELNASNRKITEFQSYIDGIKIPLDAILKSMSEFATGWYRFVSGIPSEDKLRECEEVYQEIAKELAISKI